MQPVSRARSEHFQDSRKVLPVGSAEENDGAESRNGQEKQPAHLAGLPCVALVSDGVDQIVDPVVVGQRRHVLRIFRRIRILPGIADVRVVVHRHHQVRLVVIHRHPGWFRA
jgi:hypothetical protein